MSDQLEAERRQKKLIADARAILQPTPVRLHHVPQWVRKKIITTLPRSMKRYGSSGVTAIQEAMRWLDCREAFDHWGSTEMAGRTVLVSEPYPSVEAVTSAEKFAKEFELILSISANSHWYPGATIRLIFADARWRGLPGEGGLNER